MQELTALPAQQGQRVLEQQALLEVQELTARPAQQELQVLEQQEQLVLLDLQDQTEPREPLVQRVLQV